MNQIFDYGNERQKKIIVAVDGPAASGKSSVSKAVAKALGLHHVNTGALYRALAVILRREGIDPSENKENSIFTDTLKRVIPNLKWDTTAQSVFYLGENLGDLMFDEELGPFVSKVAGNTVIRRELVQPQRQLALSEENGAVLDGRDIGTVIFPDADVKIFMTASIEERARRRLAQARGTTSSLIEATDPELGPLIQQIRNRDDGDYSREVAPLAQANDAIVIDTTGMSFAQVVSRIYECAKNVILKEETFTLNRESSSPPQPIA